MPTSIGYRVAGPVAALSVAGTQHVAVQVTPAPTSDICNWAEFLNTGSTVVCVVVAPPASPPATPTLLFPVDGVPTVPNAFMLSASMIEGKLIAVPNNGFCVSAIGASGGPSIIYVTPMIGQ